MKRRTDTLILVTALILSLAMPPHMRAVDDLPLLLPAAGEVSGWNLSGKPQTAAGDDLFLLIDGGAEIFLEYGFSRALVAEFRDDRGGAVNLEIYEMRDGDAAYGVYSFRRGFGGMRAAAGQEAVIEDYYLNMWQGRFLVTVTGLDRGEKTLAALVPLARAAAARIKPAPGRPELVEQALAVEPAASLPVYLRGRLGISNYLPQALQGALDRRESVLFRGGTADRLLLRYADSDAAAAACRRLRARLPEATGVSLTGAFIRVEIPRGEQAPEPALVKRCPGVL